MKKFFSLILILFFSFSVFSAVNAGNLGNWEENLDKTAGNAGAGYNTKEANPVLMVSSVIEAVLSLLGVIFLILVIYGGFLWMTAAGDDGKVDTARKIITAAIVGLVIVVSAYAISYFVIQGIGKKTLDSNTLGQ